MKTKLDKQFDDIVRLIDRAIIDVRVIEEHTRMTSFGGSEIPGKAIKRLENADKKLEQLRHSVKGIK